MANIIANFTFHKFANEQIGKYSKKSLASFLLFWQVNISTIWKFGKFFAKYASLEMTLRDN